jgi:hypothetical protein
VTEDRPEPRNLEFLLQQYIKLREEIQYRTGIQQQLVTLSLLGAGATFTIGANNWLLTLALADVVAVVVTLTLPESHPAMRRSILNREEEETQTAPRTEGRPAASGKPDHKARNR